MPITAQPEYEQIGETQRASDHDRDLVHELSKRLDAVWRFDQYIANAEGKPQVQQFWRSLKQQECATVDRLKELLVNEVKTGCF